MEEGKRKKKGGGLVGRGLWEGEFSRQRGSTSNQRVGAASEQALQPPLFPHASPVQPYQPKQTTQANTSLPPTVVKNPLAPVEHPGGVGVANELFELALDQFVKGVL